MSNDRRVDRDVTLVEVLELVAPFEEFERAIMAAVRRLETDGIRELVTVQFYASTTSPEIGVLLTFSDPDRMIDHMNLISGWEEFSAFARTVRLVDVKVHGVLPPKAEAWISAFGRPSKRFERHVVGFVRN